MCYGLAQFCHDTIRSDISLYVKNLHEPWRLVLWGVLLTVPIVFVVKYFLYKVLGQVIYTNKCSFQWYKTLVLEL